MSNNGFAKDTKLMMHDGSIKVIQNIKVGDKLMGFNSQPKSVEKIIKSKEKMYDIIPVKGTKYTATGEQYIMLKVSNYDLIYWEYNRKRYKVRWIEKFAIRTKSFPVKNYSSKSEVYKEAKKFYRTVPLRNGYQKYGDIVKIQIKDYIKLPRCVQKVYKGFSGSINFAEREVDIDPYLLGYWLGDGTSAKPEITTAEEEVIDYFTEYCDKNNLMLKKFSKYRYTLTTDTNYGGKGRNVFMNFLKKYGVLNNKHIPLDYLMNSKENRLKLLAGLIDSDGCNNCNTYAFNLKSEKLANDTISLARSLGFKAFKKKYRGTCTNGKNGPVTGTYYRFVIYGEGLEKVPSLLKRKQAHKREKNQNARVTGITIKSVGKAKAFELKINGNRFLLDDLTVVHA